MTDEEILNGYCEKECKDFLQCGYSNKERCPCLKGIKYGLAEGKRIGKEKQWIATEKAQKKTSEKIRKLEKENKISEEIIIGEQQEINRLEKEIKQIIERERVVPEHYLCEMIEKNKELKADLEEAKIHCKAVDEVNEKMKCCENCINYKTGNCTEDNMFYARTTKQCNKWKLAEKE